MEAQLRLIGGDRPGRRPRAPMRGPATPRWALDHQTRERGLAGVARAREVLEAVVDPAPLSPGERRAS